MMGIATLYPSYELWLIYPTLILFALVDLGLNPLSPIAEGVE